MQRNIHIINYYTPSCMGLNYVAIIAVRQLHSRYIAEPGISYMASAQYVAGDRSDKILHLS